MVLQSARWLALGYFPAFLDYGIFLSWAIWLGLVNARTCLKFGCPAYSGLLIRARVILLA